MHHRYWRLIIATMLCVIVGCGDASYNKGGYEADYVSESAESGGEIASEASSTSEAALLVAANESLTQVNQNAGANRKIIYTTTIGLVVEDYKELESNLPALVMKHGGFVASSNTSRVYNDQQHGTWIVRIPTTAYAQFLNGVSALGFTESRSEEAEDVTEEFVDVEARIKNKRILEDRIATMLKERVGKLSEVLEIERELARVREEIERMEGRLRYLKDRTSMATITLNCREQRAFQPAQAPTFLSRIQRSWSGSLNSLVLTVQNLAVVLIVCIPWIIVAGIPLAIAWRRWRRGRSQSRV